MWSRHFTPEEANEALAQVRPLAERLVERRADLLAARARMAELAARIGGNGGGIDPSVPATLARAAAAAEEVIRETVTELHDLGVVVKDLDAGLIDFPALRDGVEVLLCWQLGEEAVLYWHGADEGFEGRKPL